MTAGAVTRLNSTFPSAELCSLTGFKAWDRPRESIELGHHNTRWARLYREIVLCRSAT